MPLLPALFLLVFLGVLTAPLSAHQQEGLQQWVQEKLPGLVQVYQKLHRAPELSYHEEQTSTALAAILESLGFRVERGIGGYGVAGLLRNGEGPVVLVRTDMDALPIRERTGLAYASSVTESDEDGQPVPVMHACGHDIHMGVWIGTATWFATHRSDWKGTLLFLGQPAEERGAGARSMLADQLYERTATPDYALALHVTGDLPAGSVGLCPGYALANVDSVDITVRGRGGHGSRPENTHDPIALSARIIDGLQYIVSREVSPQDPAVVTVGSIHGGTKHNIIPDQVELQLTVRSYAPEVREKLLAAIRRVAENEARAAGFPEDRLPIVRVREEEATPATYNDPGLVERFEKVWEPVFGKEGVVRTPPVMGGEDFGRYPVAAHCPGLLFWLGATEPARWKAAQEEGAAPLPNIHNDDFAPDAAPTLRTGVMAMTLAVRDLLAGEPR